MKIVVIGAGAMGCLYGAFLSEKNEVVMLDSWQPQVDVISKNGITIEEKGQEKQYPNAKACLSGEYRAPADLVILFVKSIYTEDALALNSGLFGENTLVMTLQNGAGNDRKIAKYVRPENIIIGTTKHNCVNLGSGKSRHTASGATTIGSNHNAVGNLERVAGTLREAGFEVEVSEDIQRILWSKLFVNLSINTFTAITRTKIGFMVEDKHAWDFARRLVYEAVEVAEADGTYFDRREALESVRKVCIDAADGYSSMYQDVMRGNKTEIDAINGAIVEQAKLYGVAVPYNSLIVDLMHAIESAYKYNQQERT
ncbi:MAG: 2-dehydropantoate 2-reductase [Lachnospiraceae bacterium]|nr:2-dehydropantoate 2-reductase [Lachnospiraceae bacterium]